MRVFFAVLVLIFSLQSWTKADDIRDFEIEGMSIGDSLLIYSSKQKIDEEMITDYNSKKYSRYTLKDINSSDSKQYDNIQVHFKTNDKNYIITSISGAIFNDNEFNECLEKKEEVIKEISNIFTNSRINDVGTSAWLEADPSGKTITSQYFLNLGSDKYVDYIEIACYDWGEEAGKKYNASDHLKVAIHEKKFGKWLSEEAFD